jgi:hypothetical protein
MIERREPPAVGAGEGAWREYAEQLERLLESAERGRAGSRRSANRRSRLLNQVHRALLAGDVPHALVILDRREKGIQEAHPDWRGVQRDVGSG